VQDVPKLSYVKQFEPWGWVIGTGMFLDDVQAKTDEISSHLLRLIYITVAFSSLLLLAVVLRSLAIERRRYRAEHDLRQSRIKYKTLVETAVDPLMMLHNGACIYANKSMESLLGYTALELEAMNPVDLFAPHPADSDTPGIIEDALHGYITPGQHEVVLLTRHESRVDVLLSMSRKDLGSQKVIVLNAKDVSTTKLIEAELDASREQYRSLTDRLNIGVFRTSPGNGLTFLEANSITTRLFDVSDEAELVGTDLLELIENDQSATELIETLDRNGVVKEQGCRLKMPGPEPRTVSISLVLARDGQGRALHCDGLIEDISQQQESNEAREHLIVELQTSLMFMNQPVKSVLKDFASCELATPIHEAAVLMSQAEQSAILVQDESGEMVGIITDLVLREHVVAQNISRQTPAGELMSSPLVSIDDSGLIFEAIILLHERGIKHLAVRDSSGQVSGVISNEELLDLHRYSDTFAIEQIRAATTIGEIAESQRAIPRIVKALNDSGAHAANITRVITRISDTVLERLIDLAIERIGEPPARFAFVSLGSEGREEQTLVTDQDNAIIFEDVPEEASSSVHDYFNRFGTMVCTWLDEAGYDFCKGDVMAMNPQWCQPISTWKSYFTGWIAESSPEALMEVSIFFDFRCLYGKHGLVDQLRAHVKTKAEKQKAFLYQMAQNTLLFKVPIDFFGRISVESGGDHPNTFNIKHVLAQVVGFARIYAIYGALESTNTLRRLDNLMEMKLINASAHEDIVEAYNFLMQLRFRHQVKRIDAGEAPDNHVNINELTHMEKDMLEKVLGQINQLRKRLSLVGHNEIYF
jgi:PAS domain S-box-containing protein